MSTISESAETLVHPLLNQNDASHHVASSKQEQVRKRKQGGLTLVEQDDSGTPVEDDEAEPERSDNSMNVDDQKRLSRPIRKNKTATMKNLRPTRQRQPVRPKRRAVQSSAFDGDEERGHDKDSILPQVIRYLIDILGRSLNLVKRPLSVLMSLLILVVVFSSLLAAMENLFCSIPGLSLVCWFSGPQVGASWKCSLPGSSRFFLECRPRGGPQGAREVQQLLHAHVELNNVQEAIVGQLSLPLFIKRSETATREVSKRVELSDIPSRSVMVPLFTDFWKQARVVGRNIDKFFLHIHRTHDLAIGIMVKTEQRLERIQGLEEQERTQPFTSRVLSLIQPEPPSPFVLVREAYLAHLDRLKHDVDKLIVENKLVLDSLEELNDKLLVMGNYIAGDNQQLHDSQLSLKAGFLNKIRPNTPALQKIESSLTTLDEVNSVRKYGIAVFDASLIRLQRMSAELDDLRERIVIEEVVVEEAEIASLDFQIFMVRKGLTRMQESKAKAEKMKEKYREELHEQLNESFNT